ncbi:MAG: MOSC domain-containing protein [Gemmatimonadetes bacterium]|nr:MOSC domain-containing protein [Gemmatimonadota bacterium]MBT6144618.1 MOSC domain-containing protein [Gemmatimonadota bacterium]MBT7863698.1 MOSC domain-containing protein [Gemmatimonadota bacterium]
MEARHLTTEELMAGLPEICQSPADNGELLMISRRPAIGERDLLDEGQLDLKEGLVGDNWINRGQSSNPPRDPNPEAQLTLMNSRAADLICLNKDRWPLAGDQLYVDLDIGPDNAPAGTRLQIGETIIEVTAEPHTGCKKFVERFGMDAMTFVNSPEGKQKCTRGINTKVIQAGTIRVGDRITKV